MIINSPYVSGSLTVSCNINVCGTINGTANICTSTLFASTRVCSPNLCATTTICGPAFVGGTMSGTTLYGSTAACAPTVFGTTAVCSPTIFASTVACAPTVFGTTRVCSANLCATTTICGPSFVGGTFSGTTVSGTTLYGSTAVCAPTVFGTTAVCAPTVFGTTAVCSPTVFGTTVVCGGSVCTTGNICAAGSITGSAILSTGRITAQTLVVSTISSSVTFSSGSNIFGNSTANTQTMTGSVNITGSLTVTTTAPELTVGATGVTLGNVITDTHNVTGSLRTTGSITGVGNACFTSVCSPSYTGGTFSGTTISGTTLYGSTAVCAPTVFGTTRVCSANLCATTTICGPAFIGGTVTGTTGTFSDNVTLTRTSIMASYIVNAQGSCAVSVGAQYALQDGGNTVAWLRRNRDGSCTTELTNIDGNLLIKTGASVCTRITIASTGIACFACQVCSPSFIGGTVTGTTLYGSTAICGGAITGTTAVLTNTLKVGQCNNGEMFITIGECRTASGFAYIDFIGDTTYTDYGLRLIRGNAGANSTSQLVHRGTGDLQINTDDAASIQLRTCATDRVRITAAGCVGIGTGNPCTNLHVAGRIRTSDTQTSGAADASGIIQFGDNNVGLFRGAANSLAAGNLLNIAANDGIVFTVQSGCQLATQCERMRITSCGNVGIGTSTPGAPLQVLTTATGNGVIFRYTGGSNNPGLFIATEESTRHVKLTASGTSVSGQLLQLGAEGNTGVLNVGASNVGIGTCNPQKLFELRTGGTSTTPSQIFGGGITQAIVGVEPMITFSTNVCPAAGSATATELARAGIGFTYVSAALPSEFSIGIQCTNVCNSNFRFFNGTERMRITSAGIACFADTVCAPQIRFCGGNAALNNYEVGTWTPHYNVANSCTGVTYYTRFGYYRRIGDTVTIWGGTRVCSNGSGTGGVTITGLPFTINCIAAYTHPVGAFNKVDSGNCKVYSVLGDSTALFFREQTATGDIAASDTCFPDGTSLIWTMTYIV